MRSGLYYFKNDWMILQRHFSHRCKNGHYLPVSSCEFLEWQTKPNNGNSLPSQCLFLMCFFIFKSQEWQFDLKNKSIMRKSMPNPPWTYHSQFSPEVLFPQLILLAILKVNCSSRIVFLTSETTSRIFLLRFCFVLFFSKNHEFLVLTIIFGMWKWIATISLQLREVTECS